MKNRNIKPSGRLQGIIDIPGDKSISHRSVMLASLAKGPSKIKNFLFSADCCSTMHCMQALGVDIKQQDGELIVYGKGLHGLVEPLNVLDAGNSGTTMRLLSGILGAQAFCSVLTGDASLRKRPMGRVVQPLTEMGCCITGRQGGKFAPLVILPTNKIHGILWEMNIASAQVKSAIMLAALFGDDYTSITEPLLSRDHTERMLILMGVKLLRSDLTVSVYPTDKLMNPEIIEVPGDISSASYWLVAASIIPNSELLLKNVGMNSTRRGILDVLTRMGANITLLNEKLSGAEPVADILVKSANLKGVNIEPEEIPSLIDEIPIIAAAALFAEGWTAIKGAEELRVKETDRLSAIALEYNKLGASVTEMPDGLIIEGGKNLRFAKVNSHDDHRIAMSLAIIGMAADGVDILNPDCVNISYPDFFAVQPLLCNSHI